MSENVNQVTDKMFTRVQHYYVWNKVKVHGKPEEHPVATVVIGKRRGSGRVCRGISICSVVENFNREEGLKRAMGRMISAATARTNDERIMTPAERRKSGTKVRKSAKSVERFVKALAGTGEAGFVYKSAYNVTPTAKEAKILAD